MKRSKIIAVALAVLMMAGALVLAGCKDKGCNVGECVNGFTCTDSSCAVKQEINNAMNESRSVDPSITCNCD